MADENWAEKLAKQLADREAKMAADTAEENARQERVKGLMPAFWQEVVAGVRESVAVFNAAMPEKYHATVESLEWDVAVTVLGSSRLNISYNRGRESISITAIGPYGSRNTEPLR